MIEALKNHPFAVKAFFKRSIVLSFAVPKEELISMIPSCLTLDTFQDKYAFIACAFVETRDLRPSFFPRVLGNDFFLVGYRIFVRYRNIKGKNLRGLYILKSQTNKRKMKMLGNLFTHYNYETIDIETDLKNSIFSLYSKNRDLRLIADLTAYKEVLLPKISIFSNWKEARRFAGPLPFTFTYKQESDEILIIEGKRQNWNPRPVSVNEFKLPFLESLPLSQAKLSNAFIVEDIPYEWKSGVVEKLKS